MRWTDLSPVMRAAIVMGAVLDAGMKCWALAGLVDRTQGQAMGFKTARAIALTIVKSLGVLPASDLAWARKSG